MVVRKSNTDKALVDPKGVFGTPEKLLSNPRLDRVRKLQILRKWREDFKALSVAADEGMVGDGPDMLQRVQQAINLLKQS